MISFSAKMRHAEAYAEQFDTSVTAVGYGRPLKLPSSLPDGTALTT